MDHARTDDARQDEREASRLRVLVLIPAMNEEASLPGLFAELATHCPGHDVLVVDDGSSDRTAALAIASGARVLSHPFNLGYGAALNSGYSWALRYAYDAVVQVDADGQHPPSEIEHLLAPIRANEADVVVGSRYRREKGQAPRYEGSPLRRFASTCIGWIASLWTGQRITDPTSGFQALRREAVELVCNGGFPDDFPDVDVLISMHRAGLRLREIPTPMRERHAGTSMHGGLGVLFYFYRLFVVLMLLPVRRHSPYRKERKELAARMRERTRRREARSDPPLAVPTGDAS